MEHSPRAAAESANRAARRLESAAPWRPLSEGAVILVPLAAATLAGVRLLPRVVVLVLALATAAVALAFRDPRRSISPDPGLALAPADGRVIHVDTVWDDHWETEMVEVGIFLALYDVHVQRSPVSGTVVGQQRRPGVYHPAMTRAATHGNNQLATYLETPAGPCTVTQISGLLARRIVCWAAPGDTLDQGERLGIIKFSSQVTLRLPLSATVLVEPGDHVIAGITPLASFDS